MLDNILRNDLDTSNTVLDIPTDIISTRHEFKKMLDELSYHQETGKHYSSWYFDNTSNAFGAVLQLQGLGKIPFRLLTGNREDIIFSLGWDETFMERHIRISKVQLAYYKQFPLTPTKEDYQTWLNGLEGAFKKGMTEKGFDFCRTTLPFQRFYYEYRHDHGMDEYMQRNLSDEDFIWLNEQANG